MRPTPWYPIFQYKQTPKSHPHLKLIILSSSKSLRLSCIALALPSPFGLCSIQSNFQRLRVHNACQCNLRGRASFHRRRTGAKLVPSEHDHQLDHIQNFYICDSMLCFSSWCPDFLWRPSAWWQWQPNFSVAHRRLLHCIRGRGGATARVCWRTLQLL